MNIDLDENQIIEAADNYRDDVDFLYRLIDGCTSDYSKMVELIEKVCVILPDYEIRNVINRLDKLI